MITLSRTACKGTCPVYDLIINSDGTVLFDGKQHTKTLGKASGKISAAEIDKLIEEFDKAGYLDLNGIYKEKACPAYVTDLSTVNTSIRQNGKTKSVNHYLGCFTKGPNNEPYPPGLSELENLIDGIAGTPKWVNGI